MLLKKKRKSVPGLNTSSTADISFMLLILFLVTTSMGSNKGFYRSLPPIKKKQQPEKSTTVNANHIMQIQVKKERQVVVDGKLINLKSLKPIVLTFIERNGTQYLIQLRTERDATYEEYFYVQNTILSAYNALRDKQGLAQFGLVYALCTKEQQDDLEKEIPVRISEVYVLSRTTTKERL